MGVTLPKSVSAVCMFSLVSLLACENVVVGTGAQSVPLRFRGTPPDASVTIDDVRVGSLAVVAARGVRVLPGKHRVSVEAPGFLPMDQLVDAKDGLLVLDIALVPVPD